MASHLVSYPEASALLGVSVYYVKKAVNSGSLEGAEFEGRKYIIRDTINQYIEEHGATLQAKPVDVNGIILSYEPEYWYTDKGPLKTLAGREGLKDLGNRPGWADHTEIKKDRDGKKYYICHPYHLGGYAFEDFAYLEENGWSVKVHGGSYYPGQGAVQITITEASA